MSIPTITAFEDSPDEGQGQARDMRVRWALEEVGQPYEVRLVTFDEMEEPAYLALHPFGLIPTYQEGKLVLFESGAIILHLSKSFRISSPMSFAAKRVPHTSAHSRINWRYLPGNHGAARRLTRHTS